MASMAEIGGSMARWIIFPLPPLTLLALVWFGKPTSFAACHQLPPVQHEIPILADRGFGNDIGSD